MNISPAPHIFATRCGYCGRLTWRPRYAADFVQGAAAWLCRRCYGGD